MAGLLLSAGPVAAELVSKGRDGFTVRHTGLHAGPPEAAWTALVDWPGWWPDAHSYSGKAANLSLDVEPDGELEEEWDGGSVLHASVIQAQTGKLLRLSGALGPLQALPVNAILDFALAPEGAGTRITMTYRVGGPASARAGKLAAPVDGVMAEAFARLLQHAARPEPADTRTEGK